MTIYLLMVVILLGVLYFVYLRKSREDAEDDFFSNLDGEKVSELISLRIEKQYDINNNLTWFSCITVQLEIAGGG